MTASKTWAACLCLLPLLTVAAACGESHGTGGDGGGGGDAGRDDGAIDGDYQSCTDNTQCIVVPQSCCGSCGAATRGDAVAVNADLAGDYRQQACSDSAGCLACFMQQDPTLIGTCDEGQCAVVDLLDHSTTECDQSEDCRVRTRDCCECGGDATRAGLIAIGTDPAAEDDYTALVCAPDTACMECLPVYPPEATAICAPEGHCEVEWSDDPGT